MTLLFAMIFNFTNDLHKLVPKRTYMNTNRHQYNYLEDWSFNNDEITVAP